MNETFTVVSKEFKSKGFDFKLIKRKNRIAIYEKTRIGGTIPRIEVIRIKDHKEWTVAGVTIPAGESYPSSSSWGIDGFEFLPEQETKIQERFNDMVAFDEQHTVSTVDDSTGKTKVVAKSTKRGRKKVEVNIVIPVKEFTVKDFAKSCKVTDAIAALRLRELVNTKKVKLVASRRTEGKKGKATNYFMKVGK